MLARKSAAVDGRDHCPIGIDEVARVEDDGRIPYPLVDHVLYAWAADEATLRPERSVQRDLEVAGDYQALVDAECRIRHASGPAQNHGHGRKCLEACTLVHEFE